MQEQTEEVEETKSLVGWSVVAEGLSGRGKSRDEVRRVRKEPGQVTVTDHHKEVGFYFTMSKDGEDFTEEWHDST